MTETTTTGPESSSKLLAERSLNPKYHSTKEELILFVNAELPGYFTASVEISGLQFDVFGIIDKNEPEAPITDLKFVYDGGDEKVGFIDVMVQMCINKNEQTLGFLSFREVESYLRDANHISSLPGNGASYFPIFQKTIEALKESIVKSRGHRSGEPTSPTIADDYKPSDPPLFNPEVQGSFEEQTVQNKNFILNNVMSKHIRPFLFRDNGDIEVLFIDGTMIVVNYIGACAHCTKSLTTTMDYIQTVLRMELKQPDILVVTDS